MTIKYPFNSAATAIGSMPQKNADEACALIYQHFKTLPHWPQLPMRSQLENMYVQYSEGFPGLVLNGDKISIVRSEKFDAQLESFYADYAENNYDGYIIGADHAAGLQAFLSSNKVKGTIVKGQITGPISFGLSIADEIGRGILYDDLLAETAAKFLRLKATWQEQQLKRIASNTVLFVDEPYLSSLGSAFIAISNDQILTLLEETLGGISGIKGIHCCGGTDWSLLLRSSADIISFDAYNYADSLSCHVTDVTAFLARGGTIAWGIVPNDEDTLSKETVNSLLDRLEAAMAPYVHNSFSIKQLAVQSIITPSCGLASLSVATATHAMKLLVELSQSVQRKYGL